jgi:Holliday junction resolvase RusA-like endonuclease
MILDKKHLSTIQVRMPLFSKARPRVTSRGTFMPKEYKQKQAEMKRQLLEAWEDREPLSGPIALDLELYGEGRADADNIIGALMDSANGILWTDDRVSIIPQISVNWEKAAKADSLWILKISTLS